MNCLKLLSQEKDFRIVVADTSKINEKLLADFAGTPTMRNFLEELVTVVVLFAAVNDFYTKVSMLFHFGKGKTIFCELKNQEVSLSYPKNGLSMEEWNLNQGLLSVTVGDWSIGLHTGTVPITSNKPAEMLTFFSKQSEQLNSHYVISSKSKGTLLQELPFTEQEAVDELLNRMKDLDKHTFKWWQENSTKFGEQIWQKRIEVND